MFCIYIYFSFCAFGFSLAPSLSLHGLGLMSLCTLVSKVALGGGNDLATAAPMAGAVSFPMFLRNEMCDKCPKQRISKVIISGSHRRISALCLCVPKVLASSRFEPELCAPCIESGLSFVFSTGADLQFAFFQSATSRQGKQHCFVQMYASCRLCWLAESSGGDGKMCQKDTHFITHGRLGRRVNL